ncbi:glycosyltransferase family 87 protein [Clavibacter sp. Sh2036]|uniref:glycosyltransferase family 87 protein n=1 Tax=Clavibacter sp. Sh2036 TaxID=3397677 RepID=UPI0039E0A9B3
MRTALTAFVLLVMSVLTGWSVIAFDLFGDADDEAFFRREGAAPFFWLVVVIWVVFGAAVLLVRKLPARAAVALIILGSVGLGGAALVGPPNTSTDSARYAWDGIVQNAGESPYRYTPADPELRDLRPEWLYPKTVVGSDGAATCEGRRIMGVREEETHEPMCTALNRPKVPTIYPPMAELFFAGVRAVVPVGAEYAAFQVAGLVMMTAVTLLLLRALRKRGKPLWWAALWAWCPLVASEVVTNSHVDALGVLLALAASLLVAGGMRWRGGIALGAAIATKLIPVIAAPALLRKQPWKVITAAVVTFALLYVPYVISTGIAVLGYLPGYLQEEGYDDGGRFPLIELVVPGRFGLIAVALILAVTAGLVWRRTDPADPWLGQLVMIGVTLLAVSPRYPWYALLLIPFIAMTGRGEWFAVVAALALRLFAPDEEAWQIALGAALAIVVVGSLVRLGPDGRRRLVPAAVRRRLGRDRVPADGPPAR